MFEARIKKKLGAGNGQSLTIDVELTADDGVTVLFGSSGAGKTSILRAIAGIITPDEGKIASGEKIFFDSAARINIPMQQRQIGYVFQSNALFPHMTAKQNALYGARMHSRNSSIERVRELFSLLGIEKTAGRYPRELSGGEQQRVALARALVTDPVIMLLDEPLSAVDVSTRSRLLEEIAAIQQKSAIPFLYVTHNHSEAVRLGKNMLIIDEGKIAQQGAPLEIFNAPRTGPVARIVGAENVFAGKILEHSIQDGTTTMDISGCLIEIPYNGLAVGSRATVGLRSEDIIVSRELVTQTSARNVLRGIISNIIFNVGKAELVVDCGVDFKVSITPATVRILKLAPGREVYLLAKARAFHLLA